MLRPIFFLFFVICTEAAKNSDDGEVDLSYTCVHPANRRPDLTPVFLLHGMTASRNDWNGLYEVITLQTNRTVCMPDARNHGLSPRTEKMSFRLLSADLIRLMDRLNVSRAILVGHSMGGKTVAFTALDHPQRVDKLVVEDMRPNTVDPAATLYLNTTFQTLKRGLAFIPEGATKEEAVEVVFGLLTEAFQAAGLKVGEKDKMMLQGILQFADGRWQYSLDLDLALYALNDPVMGHEVNDGHYEGEALFIYGLDSPFKVGDAAEEIRALFPKALLEGVEGADHQVHQMKQREFLNLVISFINGH